MSENTDFNQRWLMAHINTLLAHFDGGDHERSEPSDLGDDGETPRLLALAERIGLSPFERDLLALAAAVELHGPAAAAVAGWNGDLHSPHPTMALAMEMFEDEAHWSAISPGRPLRYFGLVELQGGHSLSSRPIKIDERVLHHLVGVDYLDERLAPLLRSVVPPTYVPTAHAEVAARLVQVLELGDVVPQLVGLHLTDRLGVASAVAMSVGQGCFILAADDIPASTVDRDGFERLWTREVLMSGGLLVVDVDDRVPADVERRAVNLINASPGILVSARVSLDVRRPSVEIAVDPIGAGDRSMIYADSLGGEEATFYRVADQFTLSVEQMLAASHAAAHLGSDKDVGEALWSASRTQARPALELLAQRVDSAAGWDDLILPEQQMNQLRHLADQVAHRSVVYDEWGFGSHGQRGLGITALFSGVSGTGKTMAAEVLGNHLKLDVYKIDLSSVVSKYIGETEKNLRKVFDAAEAGGAVLLFDEADALFGRRSEVQDAHDRYANIEVSYLLQRMEEFRGLAILTTNNNEAIDEAFTRRLRFIVRFPYPNEEGRERIWEQIWPPGVGDALDYAALARFELAGGNIRSVAIDAAFRVASAGSKVTMETVSEAVKAESVKLGTPFNAPQVM